MFSSPPPFNVDYKVIFPFSLEKNAILPNSDKGDRGYVIQLKCLNYFWPGLKVQVDSTSGERQ